MSNGIYYSGMKYPDWSCFLIGYHDRVYEPAYPVNKTKITMVNTDEIRTPVYYNCYLSFTGNIGSYSLSVVCIAFVRRFIKYKIHTGNMFPKPLCRSRITWNDFLRSERHSLLVLSAILIIFDRCRNFFMLAKVR